MSIRIHWPLVVAAAAILPSGAAGGAEPATDAPRAELREVVVTAQRREQQILEVPIAIQAFQGTDLELTGVRDFNDLLRMIPGASEGRSNTGATKTYQIRGVSSYYGEPTIGYYLDEAAFAVPNRNYAPVVSAFDLERVEVLRGPQGTLYGLGSLGGTIRFITADPDLREFVGKVQAGVSGTDGGERNWNGDAAVSVPLVEDRLGLRLSASRSHLGGYAASPSFPDDPNSIDQRNARAKLKFRASDDLEFELGYQRTELEDHWGRNLERADPPAYPASTVPGRNAAEYDFYTAAANWSFAAARLELASGYVERADDGLIPLNGGVLTVRGRSDMYTQELRLVSVGEGGLEWVAGGIYQDGRNTEGAFLRIPSFPFPPPIGPRPAVLRDDVSVYETRSYAVYGELAWPLLDGRLTPRLGVRWFSDDRDFRNSDRTPSPPFAPPPATPRVSAAADTFTATSPRFNLAWRATDDTLVYLNVAKGFRSGTFNTAAGIAAAGSIGLTVGQAVDPDTLWSYEVGTKLSALDGRLLAEFAVYRFDWKDQQLNFDAGTTRTQVIVNAGDTSGTGVEYAFTWAPGPEGLTLQATGNLNGTEFDTLSDPRLFAATPNIAVGRQVASVPKQTHSLAATWRRPTGWAGTDLYGHLAWTHVARQGDPGDSGSPAAPGRPAIPGGRFGEAHDLLKARLGIDAGRWAAFLVGDNLLDDDGAIQVSGSGQTRYWPRTLGVEFRLEF